MYQKLLGQEHPDVALSLNNLAGLYYSQGRYSETEPLLRQALEMYQKLLGEEHPNTQTVSQNYLTFLQKVAAENRQSELSEYSLQILSNMENK